MGSVLQIVAVTFIIIGVCMSNNKSSVTVAFVFPSEYHCSTLSVGEQSALGKLRPKILIDLMRRHYDPAHRSEHFTCIKSTAEGATMWARAYCVDPTSNYCTGCLAYATSYLDSHCMYFSGGRVMEATGVCGMRFGDYDVCATPMARNNS